MSQHRRAVLAGLGLWFVAALVGWALFRALGGSASLGLVRWSLWGAALAVTTLVGFALLRVARSAVPLDQRAEASLAAGIGWGVGSAAGWFLDVSVGGPFTGMVLAVVTDLARREQRPWGRVALMLAAGLVGLALGVRLLGGRGSLLALVSALALGVPVLLAANYVLRAGAVWSRLAWFTTIWGVAWVGAWALTSSAFAIRTLGATSLPTEVVLACLLGGGLTALVLRSVAQPVRDGTIWALAGLAAVLLGMAINLALNAAGLHPGPSGNWLDVGYTLGLALTIPFAFDETLNQESTAAA